MTANLPAVPVKRIEECIYTVRGQRVMLDADLARVYGVTTKVLNQAIKRNSERFPVDFVFQLTSEEVASIRCQIGTGSDSGMRSQIVTASSESGTMRSQIATASKRNVRFMPYAFTEHGAIMAANVLNSPRAVQMSVFVVRAFLKMRRLLADTHELARKLAALENELKERLNVHEAAIVTILQRVMEIIDPPAAPAPPKRGIGFQANESAGRYTVRRPGARR